jgi:Kdo2-lipid IVA lauroyltransferase/acyltransferase
MVEAIYTFRANRFSRELTYQIGADALLWSSNGEGRLKYTDINQVCWSRSLMRGDAALASRTTHRLRLRSIHGAQVTLSPLHYAGPGEWEDRSLSFRSFVGALLTHVQRVRPGLKISVETSWKLRLRNAAIQTILAPLGWFGSGLLSWAKALGLERSTSIGAHLMQALGPMLPAHRVGLANLKSAFPDKSKCELDSLLRAVWHNLGRVLGEYPFINELCRYDPDHTERSRLIIDEDVLRKISELKQLDRPALFFSAHLANWELASLAAVLGVDLTVIYKPLKSTALNELMTTIRQRLTLVPVHFGAASDIVDALRRGSNVGLLVDQHFTDGVDVVFFGRLCKVNPTLARLARRFEYPIYGARAVRLSDGRFRGHLTPALDCPRDHEGRIDVAATMQIITGIVESWVREYPEQWLWLHRRWR